MLLFFCQEKLENFLDGVQHEYVRGGFLFFNTQGLCIFCAKTEELYNIYRVNFFKKNKGKMVGWHGVAT